MKTTYSNIKSLYYGDFRGSYIKVNGREEKSITVTHKLPYTTGRGCSELPSYLKGFEKYYNFIPYNSGWSYPRFMWILKEGYRENRPTYTFETTVEIFDVDFTENGKAELKRRYEMYKRNMEKYARLLEG